MTLIIIGIIALLVGIFGTKSDSPLYKHKALIKTGGILIIVIGILTASIKIINPGHVGVEVLFGDVHEGYLPEGLNLINPFVEVKEMSVQTQNYTMSAVHDEGAKTGDDAIRVLSEDGLEVTLDITILYKIKPDYAWRLFREVGLKFEDKFIRPITRSRIRQSASNFKAVDLYSLRRKEFENAVRDSIITDFVARGLILENILVRDINLPKSVKESIERKLTADQEQQRMQFVVEKEKREAERKQIEATGQAKYQRILDSALTNKVLQYEMLQVQKSLVNSPNSKIIFLGNESKNTPPVIIGH